MAGPVTLIVTNSRDITMDRVIQRVGVDRVFRFNFDLWREYEVSIVPGDFRIADPTGRAVRLDDVAKAYWRKPLPGFRLHSQPASAETVYLEAEMFYAAREIVNLVWRRGRLVLVEPDAHGRVGKMIQLEVGRRHFKIPPYEFFRGPRAPRPARDRVVKSLTSEPVGRSTYLWTTRVREEALDVSQPWFVQDVVEATHDVTVAHVRDRSFAFALSRLEFKERTLDWREEGQATAGAWKPAALPAALESAVGAYMAELGLHYGRLDFLHDGRDHWFLEVNSNGEWDWLDPTGEGGLLNKIVEEVHPDRPLHPIPLRWQAGTPASPRPETA